MLEEVYKRKLKEGYKERKDEIAYLDYMTQKINNEKKKLLEEKQ
jgi:hypothetical protein